MLARVILSQGLKPDIDTFDVPVSVGYTFNWRLNEVILRGASTYLTWGGHIWQGETTRAMNWIEVGLRK